MKLHPRTEIVTKARLKFEEMFAKLSEEFSLTYGEMFSILSGEILNLAKYAIRGERHPDDPKKRGDEA